MPLTAYQKKNAIAEPDHKTVERRHIMEYQSAKILKISMKHTEKHIYYPIVKPGTNTHQNNVNIIKEKMSDEWLRLGDRVNKLCLIEKAHHTKKVIWLVTNKL